MYTSGSAKWESNNDAPMQESEPTPGVSGKRGELKAEDGSWCSAIH
jgi:hypothetical protein